MSADEKPVRWGIMSTANISITVVEAIHQSPNSRVVAVASRELSRAQAWADKYKVPKAYGSYEELLQDEEINAIYIPLPTAFHHEWTLKSARAGKHVLCEKPFARSLAEAVEMVRVCKEQGVVLMDGVMWSHQLRYQAIQRQHLDHIGDVTHMTSHFAWRQEDPNNIRLNKELEPTGCLGDLGWYSIRAALFSFHEELPHTVFAMASTDERGAFVEFHGLLRFAGHRFANIGCSFTTKENQIFEIHGTQAVIRVQDFVWAHSREDAGAYSILRGGGVTERHVVDPGPDPFRPYQLITNFSALAADRASSDAWTLLALKTQAIHDAMIDSAASGLPVQMSDYLSRFPELSASL